MPPICRTFPGISPTDKCIYHHVYSPNKIKNTKVPSSDYQFRMGIYPGGGAVRPRREQALTGQPRPPAPELHATNSGLFLRHGRALYNSQAVLATAPHSSPPVKAQRPRLVRTGPLGPSRRSVRSITRAGRARPARFHSRRSLVRIDSVRRPRPHAHGPSTLASAVGVERRSPV